MNMREKSMAVGLGSVVGVGAVLFLVFQFFVFPLREVSARIATLTTENEELENKIKTYREGKMKLEMARRRSLPANPDSAANEYMNYLGPLLSKSKLEPDALQHSPAVDVKPTAAFPGVKKVGHQKITFTVRARGELEGLIKVMEVMQKTPFEHRILSLNIDRAETGTGKATSRKLNINMVVETLLVAKTESKARIPPGIDMKCLQVAVGSTLAPRGLAWGLLATALLNKQAQPELAPKRNYADIGNKNIFVDVTTRSPYDPKFFPPPPPKPPGGEVIVERTPDPPPYDMLRYIRLVTVNPDQATAYLRNLAVEGREIKLIARANSGYEFFRILDEESDYYYFKAKVLRVGARDVYFQVKDQIYELHMGQSLSEALRHDPLSIERLDDLDLECDRIWAKEEMGGDKAKEKEKTNTKKKGKTR